MVAKERSSLAEALGAVPDPRRQCANLRHRLVDVLVIALCAVMSGCDDFVEIEEFGKAKEDLFRRFLALPHGIPSHDTIRRVFQAVCPQALQGCLIAWLQKRRQQATGVSAAAPVVAIDGKTLRRTGAKAKQLGPLHLVSAWVTANGLTLGQVAVDAKSNEITAIPELLELLDLRDAVVTIDAAGCQKEIAKKIVENGGDYVLALKENQPTLHAAVVDHFLEATEQRDAHGPDGQVRLIESTETGHGRTETRQVMVAPVPAELAAGWVGLATLVMVIRHCVVRGQEATTHIRYFISSLPSHARQLGDAVRSHWGIENGLHWVLDVAFNEDRMRQRHRNAVENLAMLNRLAVSLLRADQTVKAGVKCKRKRAGWNDDYLLHLLGNFP